MNLKIKKQVIDFFETTTNDSQVYEQPLNERVRLFMRLESVFSQADRYLGAKDEYETQLCLDAIFSLLNLTRRYELRSECLKELGRIRITLQSLEEAANMSDSVLKETLEELNTCSSLLHEVETKRIDRIRNIEFLNTIKQRNIHDTGVYIFEIPELQYWLNQDQLYRKSQMKEWLNNFAAYKRAVTFLLKLIRDSVIPSEEVAINGMFLKSIDAKKGYHQMLRVGINKNHNVFPRISGGKHRFAIRFLNQNITDAHAVQSKDDIRFFLQTCLI